MDLSQDLLKGNIIRRKSDGRILVFEFYTMEFGEVKICYSYMYNPFKSNGYDESGSVSDFEPVLINDEWIKRLGFPEGEGLMSVTPVVAITVRFVRGYNKDYKKCPQERDLKYVHQLQNYWYLGTSKKLEPTLPVFEDEKVESDPNGFDLENN